MWRFYLISNNEQKNGEKNYDLIRQRLAAECRPRCVRNRTKTHTHTHISLPIERRVEEIRSLKLWNAADKRWIWENVGEQSCQCEWSSISLRVLVWVEIYAEHRWLQTVNSHCYLTMFFVVVVVWRYQVSSFWFHPHPKKNTRKS